MSIFKLLSLLHLKRMILCYIFINFTINCSAQEFYYSNNRQISLYQDRSTLAIWLNNGVSIDIDTIEPANLTSKIYLERKNLILLEFSEELSENFQASSLGIDQANIRCEQFGSAYADGYKVLLTPRVMYRLNTYFTTPTDYFSDKLSQYSGTESDFKYNIHIVEFSDVESALSFSNEIYESGYVRYAHPCMITRPELSNDPLYPLQYQMDNSLGFDCHAEDAWAISTGSPDITVAIFDSGGEAHEDIVDELGNSRMLPGFNNIWLLPEPGDDDTGWIYGIPNPINNSFDGNGHGMACAGIIGASHNNIGVRGIAPQVKLMPVNIFYGYQLTDFGETVLAYYLAAEEGADVISNSWGFDSAEIQWDALDEALSDITNTGRDGLGCVIVFSSGNTPGGVNYPATHPDVIAVGALAPNGQLADYSQYGPELDLVAPSSATLEVGSVATTDRMGVVGYSNSNYTQTFGGTSAACPLVAGIASLVLSENPDMTEAEVRERLYCSATNLFDPILYGHGLVNAHKALLGCESYCSASVTFNDEVPLVVQNQSLAIDENMNFQHPIIVGSGGYLSFTTSVIQFGPNAKIIVKDGGALHASDGVTLTSACDQMWPGIEVWDDPTISGYGSVNLDGTHIENAHIGVAFGQPRDLSELTDFLDANGQPTHMYYSQSWKNYSQHGVFIFCSFTNCGIGINIPGSVIAFPKSGLDLLIEGCSFSTGYSTTAGNSGILDFRYGLEAPMPFPNIDYPWYGSANSETRGAIGVCVKGIQRFNNFTSNTFNNLECGVRGINAYFHISDCAFDNIQYGIFMDQAIMNGISVVHSIGNAENEVWGQSIDGCVFRNFFDPNPADASDLFRFPQTHHWFGQSYNGIDQLYSNTAAVRLDNMPDMKLTDNFFGFDDQDVDPSVNVNGIYLNNCSNLSVHTNNQFIGLQRGVIVLDSDNYWWGKSFVGQADLTDDGNRFIDCLQDVATGKDNFNFLLRCNSFSHVLQGTFWANKGVLGNQGSDPEIITDATTGAGNQFFPQNESGYILDSQRLIYSEPLISGSMYEDLSVDHIFEDFESGDPLIIEGLQEELEMAQTNFLYYYHGEEELLNRFRPDVITGSNGIPVPLTIDYDPNSSCDSPYNIIGDDDNSNEVLFWNSQDIASKLDRETDKLEALQASLDNYHTTTYDMLEAIYGGISNQQELKEFLKMNSPLSTSVLEAYMLNYNVPSVYLQEVLNINSVIDARLHALFIDKTESMPDVIRGQLRSVYLLNPEVQTMAKLRRRIIEYSKIYKAIIQSEVEHLLIDREFQDAKNLLADFEGIYPKVMQLDVLLMERNLTAAKNYLLSWEAENEDIEYWIEMKKNQLGWITNGAPRMEDLSECFNLKDLNPSNISYSQALGIIHSFGYTTPMIIPNPELQSEKRRFEYYGPFKISEVAVYPNPASDYIRIHMQTHGILHITLYDHLGSIAECFTISKSQEDGLIELGDMPAGAYNYSITQEDVVLAKGSLIIMK